ncbi:protein IQ-DOMAIN 5-like [Salvia miltiorrhiza]|uniref:protein IQ-DOMAIN 5-like n=1 Tax=Salvia miltiorrhiza TaxID=226208 RepID=UPI0025AC4EBD|nr:protein IQ-DOMAIN 5-like [Salvia miltiorrhiza]
MGAPRRWIKQLLGLKKSEKIVSSEEENSSGNVGKSWNQSKPSIEPEKGRYENELNENVDTEFEDANWQWEMDQSGGAPSTSLQAKNAAQLSEDPPAVSPRVQNAPQQQPQEDWREEWMGVYAKEGNFKSALDSPNSPEEQSAARLDDDAVEGWATPDVREMFESDPDPISPHSSSLEVEYAALDAEDANFLSALEEDGNMQEESAARCIQTAIRGFLLPNEAPKTDTRLPMSEESAAIRIQTIYRGFMARRAFRAIRGLARLQALVKGHTVKRQAAIALRCIQALVKVQAHSRAKHVKTALENQSVQKKLIQQLEVEAPAKRPEYIQNGWCNKVGSAAEIRARWQKRQEAAAKREKARAYALARQWQAGIRQQPQPQPQPQHQQQQEQPQQEATPAGFPSVKTEWGWNWLERWMAVRPWETDILDDASLRDGTKSPTSERVSLVNVPTSPLTERKPLSSIGNGKTIPRFNITIEKSSSPRRLSAALETPTTPVSSRSPRTPMKAIGSRSFSTPRERSNLSDFQDKKRLSLPGTMHGARLLAQSAVNSPRTRSPRTESPRVQSPQKAGNPRSKLNGNDVKPSKLSR